jgi:hypothetical protein
MKVVIVFAPRSKGTEIHEIQNCKSVFTLSEIQETCSTVQITFVYNTVSFIVFSEKEFIYLKDYLTDEQSLYDTSIERIEQKHGCL